MPVNLAVNFFSIETVAAILLIKDKFERLDELESLHVYD
jgi:hypothetical protein